MSDTENDSSHIIGKEPDGPVVRVELEVPAGVDLVLIINGVQVEFD
jgi:hypothetical protein